MKNYPVKLSITLALMMSLFVLPIRLRQGQGSDMRNLVGSEIVIFVMCLACSLSVFYIIRSVEDPYRWAGLLLSIFCCGCLSIAFYYSSNFFFEDYPLTPMRHIPFLTAVMALFWRGVIVGAVVGSVAWFFEGYRRAEEERFALEHLKAENLLARLNTLQKQMDPHFLFNSLNVLKSGSKDEWTKEYVVQLSRVYRYLLTLNQENLVRVEDEIEFVSSYIHVLRQRFEDGLQVSVVIGEGVKGRYIPPMALQTLIENAIKHNSASLAEPLHIRIYDEENLLIVQNKLQWKNVETVVGCSAIGLKNLTERYKLIAGVLPVIIRNESFFVVKLPLLDDPDTDTGR